MEYGPMRTFCPSEASGETMAVGWITPEMSANECRNDEVFFSGRFRPWKIPAADGLYSAASLHQERAK
jgi:hypothetical protein